MTDGASTDSLESEDAKYTVSGTDAHRARSHHLVNLIDMRSQTEPQDLFLFLNKCTEL